MNRTKFNSMRHTSPATGDSKILKNSYRELQEFLEIENNLNNRPREVPERKSDTRSPKAMLSRIISKATTPLVSKKKASTLQKPSPGFSSLNPRSQPQKDHPTRALKSFISNKEQISRWQHLTSPVIGSLDDGDFERVADIGGTDQFSVKCSEIKQSVAKILSKYSLDENGTPITTQEVRDPTPITTTATKVSMDTHRPSIDTISAYMIEISKHINQEIYKIDSEIDRFIDVLNDRRYLMINVMNDQLNRILKYVGNGVVRFTLNYYSIVPKYRQQLAKMLDDDVFPKMELRIDPEFYGLRQSFADRLISDSSIVSTSQSKLESVATLKKDRLSCMPSTTFGQAFSEKCWGVIGAHGLEDKKDGGEDLERLEVRNSVNGKSRVGYRVKKNTKVSDLIPERPRSKISDQNNANLKKLIPVDKMAVEIKSPAKAQMPSPRFPSPVLSRFKKGNAPVKDEQNIDKMNLFQNEWSTLNLYSKTSQKIDAPQTRTTDKRSRIKESKSLESKEFKKLLLNSQLKPLKNRKQFQTFSAADSSPAKLKYDFQRKSSSKTTFGSIQNSGGKQSSPKSLDGSQRHCRNRLVSDHFDKQLRDKDFTPLF